MDYRVFLRKIGNLKGTQFNELIKSRQIYDEEKAKKTKERTYTNKQLKEMEKILLPKYLNNNFREQEKEQQDGNIINMMDAMERKK